MQQRATAKVHRVWTDHALSVDLAGSLWAHCEGRLWAADGEHAFSQTSAAQACGAVIVLPDGTPAGERQAIAAAASKSGKFTHILQTTTAAVVAFAHSEDVALVVDIGARGTRCCAVVDGCVVSNASCYTSRGGRSIVGAFRVRACS